MTDSPHGAAVRTTLFLMAAISMNTVTPTQAMADDSATLVVHGRVWTGDADRPWAESVAVGDDRILVVGGRANTEALVGPATKILDADDGLIVPGFIDSHIHFITGGARLTSVQLRDAASAEEFSRRIAEYAKDLPAGTWVTGGDWDHTRWGGELPDRIWIDRVTPNQPVWIQRLDGHMALANSAAMRLAGVAEDVADIAGGEIIRDDDGRLTGVFKDNAMSLIGRSVPPATLEQQLAAIEAAVNHVAAHGVTAVHHMGSWEDLQVFRIAYQRGLLKIRIYACTPLAEWRRLADEVARHGHGNDWLRIGGLKGFVDGSLGSHTAAFLEPYSDTPAGRGLLVNRPEDLQEWTTAADRAGLQVVVHAIGDRAIRLQLDVYQQAAQENGPRDRRFRIEHAQHIHPQDIARFAKLGVIASMQPYHCIDDGRWAEGVIGPQRSATTYAFRSQLDSGARLAFGSDWFVAPPTPLEGIYAAVTRRTLDGEHPDGWVPEQKITVLEALRAYTADAAYAGFMENATGSLVAGKLADLIILDRDITAIPPHTIREAKVRATVIGGQIVYQSPEF